MLSFCFVCICKDYSWEEIDVQMDYLSQKDYRYHLVENQKRTGTSISAKKHFDIFIIKTTTTTKKQ